MTVEDGLEPAQPQVTEEDIERDTIIKFLTQNNEICFKSQQKWESDLTQDEKFEIGLDIFKQNKLQFLIKFGKYLKYPQLNYFSKIVQQDPDLEEINILINDLTKISQNVIVKNRRYQAMVQMIQKSSYFSEVEMMKRNPLLYNQLIGQYLTRDEVKERDKYKMNNQTSFVKILMEGIERDNAEEVRQQEEEIENNQMEEEEEDSDEDQPNNSIPRPSTSHWGEFEGSKKPPNAGHKSIFITPEERKLLKDEFVTTMYQSFLDGKDTDFDYKNIDNDTSYDDMVEIDNDEEEKYFASEEVGESRDVESSEDELDVYMNTLH